MADIWVTSDTHFQHKNIVEKYNRGSDFSTIQEHDETIIENWNSLVKPGDKVYHLGDVMFGDKSSFHKLWCRLNGKKRLVVGNHDDIKFLTLGSYFQKVVLWRQMHTFGLIFTHVPINPMVFKEGRHGGEVLNVHGHTHEAGSPEGNYRSVCLEKTDYKPVNIEDLRIK